MYIFHIVFYLFSINSYFVISESTSVVFNQCDQTISRYQFILQSPGYPNNYPININCEFILEGHHSCATEFHFQLVDFDLPYTLNCKDRLEIIGHESLCGILTGVRMFNTEIGHNLHLRFTSNRNDAVGKGFKIVITRLPCSNNVSQPFLRSTTTPNLPKCCADSYNSRRFFLASPNFPNSNNNPSDCIYRIYRANPNICRLRIHAKYFWTGLQETNNCNNGYLEIDGKKICGCHSDLDIISQFDQSWANYPKIIRYKNVGLPRTNYNGFVIEVIQDECPTRYSPSLETNSSSSNVNKKEKVPQFYYYNDQLNRVRFPHDKYAEILNKKTHSNIAQKSKLSTIDYYFFRAPDYDDFLNHEREERNYFESTDPNSILPNNNVAKCTYWGYNDFQVLSNEVLWKKMPQCLIQELRPNCYDVKLQNGFLLSPGYSMYYYPANLHCCYRLGGFCGIHFTVVDFQLEPSYNCDKDAFILYNKYKYCGTHLQNKYFKFDLSSREYEDIQFITDSYYCDKGFKIYFEQIPCLQTTSYQPPVTTITPSIMKPCGGNIHSNIFDINISNMNEECIYVVHKIDHQDICGLELLLIEFDLSCGNEYLMINTKQYCGKMSGETKWVTFDPDNLVTIAYRRRINHRPVLSSIVLRGRQITEDCDPFILDVPAQRRLKISPKISES